MWFCPSGCPGLAQSAPWPSAGRPRTWRLGEGLRGRGHRRGTGARGQEAAGNPMGPFGDRPTLRALASRCGGLGGAGPKDLSSSSTPACPPTGSGFCSCAEGWSRAGAAQPHNHCPGSWGLVWDLLSLGLQSGWERRGSTQELLLPIGWVLLSRGPRVEAAWFVALPAPPGGTSLAPSPLRASNLTGKR